MARAMADQAPANPATLQPPCARDAVEALRALPHPAAPSRAQGLSPARPAPRPFILAPAHRRHRARGARPPWLLQQQRPRAHKIALPHGLPAAATRVADVAVPTRTAMRARAFHRPPHATPYYPHDPTVHPASEPLCSIAGILPPTLHPQAGYL